MGQFPPGKALNLGLIVYGSLETVTGGFLYDRKLVDHLRSRGDRVRVFSLPWRNYAYQLLDNFSLQMFQCLSSERLDVLIQDELNHPSLFMMNHLLKARIHYPIVSIIHHLRSNELWPDWQNRFYRRVEKHFLSTVDGFVYNSLTTRSSVETLIGSCKPCVMAYPGRDSVQPDITRVQVEERSKVPGPLRVLFVGSLIPRKELHTLISALDRLSRETWRLNVVGGLDTDPDYTRGIKYQIEQKHLETNIRLLGTLTGSDLASQYSYSHILAVPSSYEGFGIVYIEAMGFGMPALASTAGAAQEIISHERNGFLVNPGDTKSIAEHIDGVSRDRKRLGQMSLAALDRYSAHPTWSESAENTREFFREMAACKNSTDSRVLYPNQNG